MTKRVLMGGVLAGIAMFMWGAISHMVLQLGDAGLSQLKQNEDPVLAALRQNIKEPGLYFYPGFATDHPTEADQQAWTEKYRQGPAGLLLYQPVGGEFSMGKHMALQAVGDIVMGLLAALLLAGTGCWLRSYFSRAGFVALIGLMPFLAVNLPYWNWYGFPTTFTLAQLADRFLGFVVIGLVLGAIVKPRSEAASPVVAENHRHSAASL